ncbi:cellulase family glycosylhydrolase [Kocuria sp. cx-116]|uniref:cellulase family glycosylhydrolase n=1 Tax=Kocuria sp. cx-116 TaxID=2771378 RepID=UPI00168751E2|nr:cellulase family glycosylhydrolase [Kocuria sp. cx-116]MBD2761389.1 cellulase family glycosylhydrolase [Kocuria sp. cx-116]
MVAAPLSTPARPSVSSRRRRSVAVLGTALLLLTACSDRSEPDPTPELTPTGPIAGVERNAPLHSVDPAEVAQARDLPETYPGSSQDTGGQEATVTLRGGERGEDYRHGSVGLSLEATDLADQRLNRDNPDLVSILDSLNEPTVRFGGNSTDRRFYFTASDEPVPTDWPLNEGEEITKVTPDDLKRVAELAERTDSSVILSANLARYDPKRAGELAHHAKEAFDERLVGLMVGNEPNGFYQGAGNDLTIKGPDWDQATYAKQLTAYAKAIHDKVPTLRIVAPAAYSADWWNAAADAPNTDPMAMAVHQYPLSECGTQWEHQQPTVANAVDPATRNNIDRLMDEAARDAADHDLPLWITETSLSACSGSNEITETQVAAVHQAEYSMRVQEHGAERVAAHSSLAPCRGGAPMSVLCSSGTLANPGEAFSVRANGLALALIASIPEGNMVETSTSTENLTSYAVEHGNGTVSVVLTDYRNPARAKDRTTNLRLPFRVDYATQSQLRGPSWTAEYPVASLFEDHEGGGPSATATGGASASGAASSAPEYPADPNVALSVERALQTAPRNAVSVDGYGLPMTPVGERPRVGGVKAGSRNVSVTLPAGSTTVLTLKKTQPSPSPQESR